MRDHRVSWKNMENTENMEKVENIDQITSNNIFMIANDHPGQPAVC